MIALADADVFVYALRQIAPVLSPAKETRMVCLKLINPVNRTALKIIKLINQSFSIMHPHLKVY